MRSPPCSKKSTFGTPLIGADSLRSISPAINSTCIGFDSADAVSGQYANPFPFTGGKLLGVGIDVSEEQYLDLELEAAAMLSRE